MAAVSKDTYVRTYLIWPCVLVTSDERVLGRLQWSPPLHWVQR